MAGRAQYADPPSTLNGVLSLLLKTLTHKPRKGSPAAVVQDGAWATLVFAPPLVTRDSWAPGLSRHLGGR